VILLISCFITHQRPINRYDRLDIFKATLTSYSKINWDAIYLFVKFDEEFLPRRKDFINFLHRTFPATKIFFQEKRLELQDEWAPIIRLITKDEHLVWFTQNDDHVFVDVDTSMIDEGINLLLADNSSFNSLYYSHWPEILKLSGKLGTPVRVGRYVKFNATLLDSIQIFNSKLLRFIFLDLDWGGRSFKRIDSILLQRQIWQRGNTDISLQTIYVPLRELCRKFEGYSHVNMNNAEPLDLSYQIKTLNRSRNAIQTLVTAPHVSDWTTNNQFSLPEEWLEDIIKYYQIS
jgi:hypothetical protein